MDKRLIEEVSQWPILYDTHCPEYKNVELKNSAWREITMNIFGKTNPMLIDNCKNKWKNLRDTFVKSQRKKDKLNSKPWKLEKEMKFLIPHINPKVPFPNQTRESLNISIERRYVPSPEESHSESSWYEKDLMDLSKRERSEDDLSDNLLQHVETVMEDSPTPRQPNKRRKRNESMSNMVPHSLHFLDNFQPYYEPVQSPANDCMDLYFLGIAALVKEMQPINRVFLKRAISNLVFDMELSELEDKTKPTPKET